MNATVNIDADPKILTLFESEDKVLSNNRASYSIAQIDDKIVFEVQADDAVAMRAVLSLITKTLSVYEKMKKVTQNDTGKHTTAQSS